MKTVCIKAMISGKVQGVFFRDSTRQKANQLQLTGWVKNTADGKVELIACGNHDNIVKLTEWLWQGSEQSEVSDVQWQEIPCEYFTEFSVRRGS